MLLIRFPFKILLYKLSVPFYSFLFLHVSDVSVFILSTIPRFEPVSLIQDFQQDKPLKRIYGVEATPLKCLLILRNQMVVYICILLFCTTRRFLSVVALLAQKVRSLSNNQLNLITILALKTAVRMKILCMMSSPVFSLTSPVHPPPLSPCTELLFTLSTPVHIPCVRL